MRKKDIRMLKIWPTLEKEGFKIKDFKVGNVVFGKGAILMPDIKKGFPFIQIEPLPNGHWKFLVDYFDHASSWETTPGDIQRNIFPKQIETFKSFLNDTATI